MSSSTELLSPLELEHAQRQAVHGYACEDTRFYRALVSGKCSPKILQRFALAQYHSTILFCGLLAEFAVSAPDPQARLLILENLMEEEGIYLHTSRGLVVRPEARHTALALKFLEACGGKARPLNGETYTTAQAKAFLDEGRWLEAVAFLLIGQELTFAPRSNKLYTAFLKNGFAEDDIVFYAIHGQADLEHGRQALEMVTARADTVELQHGVIAAARAGARIWFDVHGGGVEKTILAAA